MDQHLRRFEDLMLKDRKQFPYFKAGDTIEVKIKTKDGEKIRIQSFQGIVIERKNKNTSGESFTVMKIMGDDYVEKIFPIYSNAIDSIIVKKVGKVRRAKITYLRKNVRAKIKSKVLFKTSNNGLNKTEADKVLDKAKESDVNLAQSEASVNSENISSVDINNNQD